MTYAGALIAAAAVVSITTQVTAQQRPAEPAAASTLNGNATHGRYLVERVAMCGECHSTRDISGNVIAETRFLGGPLVVAGPPFAGTDWPNRTPRIARLPGYSDALALRLLTQGAIGRDGKQLRAPMPRFRMTNEDAADVIAFLRSLQ